MLLAMMVNLLAVAWTRKASSKSKQERKEGKEKGILSGGGDVSSESRICHSPLGIGVKTGLSADPARLLAGEAGGPGHGGFLGT
jgi:hypothetical protein